MHGEFSGDIVELHGDVVLVLRAGGTVLQCPVPKTRDGNVLSKFGRNADRFQDLGVGGRVRLPV